MQRPHPPICIGGTRREAHAAHRRPLGPALEPPGRAGREVGRELATCCCQHCADIGRDPSEITLSTHIRLRRRPTVRPVAEQAAAFAEAGLDLGIVYLPPPHDPSVLEPLAEALAPLAD